jgi:hypothetical protein
MTAEDTLKNLALLDELAAMRPPEHKRESVERTALVEAHKALTHAQRLIDKALGVIPKH